MKYTLFALLGFVLVACQQTGPSPSSAVYAAKNGYEAALVVAVTYNKLPRCGTPTSPPLCSDQAAVNAIRKASDATATAIDAAEKTVRDPAINADIKSAATLSATNALTALQTILALYVTPKPAPQQQQG